MEEFNENLIKLFDVIDQGRRGYIHPGQILRALKTFGITRDDPRIFHVVKVIDSLDPALELDVGNFKKVISSSYDFISNTLSGGLIIPEFQVFCDYISRIYENTSKEKSGRIADYIPDLALVDPDLYGVSICTIDGQKYNIGNTSNLFCLQSTSKPISYCLALEECGEEKVHRHVGREPSGHGFNELTLNRNGLPHNPLLNAGAIMTTSLIKPNDDAASRIDYIMSIWKRLCGGVAPSFDLGVYLSERDSADRNFALGYFMKEHKAFEENVDLVETLKLYFQCCAILANTEMLSVAASTLANSGICPLTNDGIFSPTTVKNALSMMYSCGMYDFSGEFAFTVGLPAKSGVSGALMIVVPNVMGIAVFSPKIDEFGNSVRGVSFCRELVEHFNFHNYDSLLSPHDKIDPRNKNSEVMKKLSVFSLITHEIGRISEQVDLKVILDNVVQIALKIINADRGTIFVNDKDTNELYAFIQQDGKVQEIRFPNKKGIAGMVFREGKSIIIHDPYNDSRFNQEIDRETGYKTKNILCAPIKTVNDVTIGVIQLLNRGHGNFNDEDKKLLDLITSQASLAILHAHNQRKELERKKVLDEIRALNLTVLEEMHLNMLPKKLQKMLRYSSHCQGILLFHFDEKKNLLVLTNHPEHTISLPSTGVIKEAVHTQKSLVFDAGSLSLIEPYVREKVNNAMIMPLICLNREVVGVLVAYNKRDGEFVAEDIKKIEEFLPEIAITVEHALIYDRIVPSEEEV